MRFSSLFFLCLFFSCANPSSENKVPQFQAIKPIQLDKAEIKIYQLKADPLIDSLLSPIQEFNDFTNGMERLINLKPKGISSFLLETINQCNKLLKHPIPPPFNTPEIQSRLKVVKTELLKSRYYSVEEQEEELNQSFKALFIAYTAYLKRIEDFSLDFQEEELLIEPSLEDRN